MKGKKKIIKNLSRLIVFIVGISMMAMSLTALASENPVVPDPEAIEVEYEIHAPNYSREDADEPSDEGTPEPRITTPVPTGAIVDIAPTNINLVNHICLDPILPPSPVLQNSTVAEIAANTPLFFYDAPGGNRIGSMTSVHPNMLSFNPALDTSVVGEIFELTVTFVAGTQTLTASKPIEIIPPCPFSNCTCSNPVVVDLGVLFFQDWFVVGTTIEAADLILMVEYGCGALHFINVTSNMVTGFDSSTPGPQTIRITYRDDYYVDFNLTIVAPPLGSTIIILPVAPPGEVVYYIFSGTSIFSLGIQGKLIVPGYGEQHFIVTDDMVPSFNPNLLVRQYLPVHFGGVQSTLPNVIAVYVLHNPFVCACPPDCCGDGDCCGLDNCECKCECPPPTCNCPPDCCGDDDCCGLAGCECLCMCICPECDELLRNCKCCDICGYPCVCLVPGPNRDALREAKRIADTIVRGNHTSATWYPFIAALEQARIVYANQNATQAEIDAATRALLGAKGALLKYPINQVNQGNVTTGAAPKTGDMSATLPLLAGFLLSMSSVLGGTSLRRKLKK